MPAKGEKKKGERGLGPNRGTSSRSPYPNVANTPVRGTSERISKRMTQIAASDLIAQQNHLDPYSFYKRLREQGPLFHVADYMGIGGAWIATNYEDAIAILKDPRLIKDRLKVSPSEEKPGLQHPEQLQMLQRDPTFIGSAVEELLRYTAPVSLSDERWASEDILMHGTLIRKGELVLASLIAVNADPQQFHDPETLDILRRENQHLAFGKGIHYCLGAPLARLEGQIAFGTLLRRLPNLRLACAPEQLVWNHNPMLRGLVSFPVEF